MKNWLRKLLIFLSALFLVIILGCSTIQDAITPCYINPILLADANDTGKTFMPFTTVFDAERIIKKFDFLYSIEKATLELRYGYLRGAQLASIAASRQLQQKVFSLEGPLGLMFPTLLGGTLGTLLLSKPKDKKKIAELEEKIKNGS